MRQQPASQIVLALDVGSSSIRCTAYEYCCHEETLTQVASVSHKMRLVQPNSGTINVRPLLDRVDTCVDEVIQRLLEVYNSAKFQVVAVGFSTFVMNLVGVGREGEVVGPDATLSYACNSEAVTEEVHALKSDLGAENLNQIYRTTGAPIHAAYALAQLRVLYALKVQTCRYVHKWQTIASICLARWVDTKFLPISYSEASWTGLINYNTCEYESAVTDLLPEACLEALPDLADFDESDVLRKGIPPNSPYYIKWPELRNAKLFLGVGDGACANIGSKCTDPSRIACTVGTSAAARIVVPLPIKSSATNIHFEPGLFCYRIDKQHILMGGALTDGGSVVEWICQLLNLKSEEDFQDVLTEAGELLEDDIATSTAKANLTFVPFLSGERSTGFRAGATGALLGLTRATTPTHLFKACLEGLTLRLSAVVELLGRAIDPNVSPQIIASGKALETNTLLRIMLADSTGLPVILDDDITEGTSRGIAQLVAEKAGCFGNNRESYAVGPCELSGSVATHETFHNVKVARPRSHAKAYWSKAKKLQNDLIEAISPMYET